MDVWHSVIKCLEVILGIALLYFRFCLYETEEGHLQNALAELWIRISERSESARMRFVQLLAESAQFSQRFFNFLLGSKLLSSQAVFTSGCFLLISAQFTYAASYFYAAYQRSDSRGEAAQLLEIAGFVCLLLFLLYSRIYNKRASKQKIITAYMGVTLALELLAVSWRSIEPAALIVAIALDLVWLLVIRRATAWALNGNSVWRYVFFNFTAVVVTSGCFVALPGRYHDGLITRAWVTDHLHLVSGVVLFQRDARFFVAAVSLLQLAYMLFGFFNWVIWPVFARVVYAAERYQLFRERKFFAVVGFALLIHATSIAWIKKTIELIAGSD